MRTITFIITMTMIFIVIIIAINFMRMGMIERRKRERWRIGDSGCIQHEYTNNLKRKKVKINYYVSFFTVYTA